MKIFDKKSDLKKEILSLKSSGKSIGFVPTMGALHNGHISLIKQSIQENSFTVCSIFVNPTQFNNKKDLLNYPRPIETDLQILSDSKCDIAFVPTEKDIYPEADTRTFNFGQLDKVLEGKFRPGHFNGVAQVVSKLFNIVEPHKAYFGEKDLQQLAIIKALTEMLNLGVEIISCPTMREIDGLAMSSRNKLLSPSHRASAMIISQTLFKSKEMKNIPLSKLKSWVIDTINSDKNLKVEYFEIVDFDTLNILTKWPDSLKPIACIAVFAGEVRLIDNVRFF